jgi:hypothetical protein
VRSSAIKWWAKLNRSVDGRVRYVTRRRIYF